MRAAAPTAFEALSRVPATFLKDHSKRQHPVLLSYQRPHLAVDPRTQRLTGVFWAPPFEGPLRDVELAEITAYYDAYRLLHAAIEAAPRWVRRLQSGEMLVFNNRRMLHGRGAFKSTAGGKLKITYFCHNLSSVSFLGYSFVPGKGPTSPMQLIH